MAAVVDLFSRRMDVDGLTTFDTLSENSKANRIETSERPGGISRICSMEVVKNSEENSENKRCYANTSYDPAQGCC